MPKNNVNDVAHRAWNILRALLCARKGAVFKRRFMMDVRVVPRFLKSMGRNSPRGQLHYGEYELSFDKTPVFHVKMHRPSSMRFNIPCITSQVDFDYDSDHDEVMSENDIHQDGSIYEYYDGTRRSFLLKSGEDEGEYETCEEKIPAEEEGIDMRAEEFIAKFRQQMRLQRQISYLQYHESTPKKGTS